MTVELLDRVHEDLLSGDGRVSAALDVLASSLQAAKRELPDTVWTTFVEMCRAHPLRDLLHQDPLTARAFAMSRGYQGDAELLDIIYAGDYRNCWTEPVTTLGESIFRHTIQRQAPAAVRERRRYLATQIDACCVATPGAAILSVACGHLRELEVSLAFQARAFGRLVGLDRDTATLAYVERTWGPLGVEARSASIEMFLSNEPPAERFDLIYVAGLYDYLDELPAQYVTEKLFGMLHRRGRLLIGNYTPENGDAGYMEAFMGWELAYRDAAAMRRLVQRLPAPAIASVETANDQTGAVIYLDVRSRERRASRSANTKPSRSTTTPGSTGIGRANIGPSHANE